MSEECPKKEAHVCNGCCEAGEIETEELETGETKNEESETGETKTGELEAGESESEEPEPEVPESSESENQEKITVTNSMDLQGTHFLYNQATEKSIKILDYDYKRCNGCGMCVEISPTKALE